MMSRLRTWAFWAALGIGPASAAMAQQRPSPPSAAPVAELRFAPPAAAAPSDMRLQTPVEALPPGRSKPASGLTLADLEQIALARNPTLAQAAANVQAARGTWLQAGLYPNPTIGYMGSEMGNEGRAGQQGAFIGQEIVTGGKLKLNRYAASQQVRQAEALLGAQQLRVINDVRTRYFQVLVAQRSLDLAGQLQRIGNEGLRSSEALLRAMEISQRDLLQARIEADRANVIVLRARNRRDAAWRNLTAVLGMPELAQQPLAGDLEQSPTPLDWDQALGRLLAESPELAAASADANRAAWALRRAHAEPIPNLDLQASTQYDAASEDQIASVQIGMPVPVFNRNQGNVRRAAAELTAARAEVSRIELDLQNRLAAAFERYANARQQTEIYSNQILPNARRALEITAEAYRDGKELSYLNLLTAQRTFFETSVTYLEALGELQQSRVEIEGLLLSGALSRPGE